MTQTAWDMLQLAAASVICASKQLKYSRMWNLQECKDLLKHGSKLRLCTKLSTTGKVFITTIAAQEMKRQ